MPDLLTRIMRLEEATRKLSSSLSAAETCQKVVDLVADTFLMDICALYLLEPGERLVLAARYHYPVAETCREIAMGQGIVGWVAEKREPALVPDVRADLRYLKGIEAARSEIAVPLVYDGQVQGVLDVESRELAAFDRNDLLLLSIFAHHASWAVHSARQRERTSREIERIGERLARLDRVHEACRTLVDASGLEAAMRRLADLVASTLGHEHAAVLLLDPELDELEIVAAHGHPDAQGLRIPTSRGATGYAVRNTERVIIGDVTSDPRYVPGIRGGRSELAVPILSGGRAIGVLDVESPDLDAFDEDDAALLGVVASYAAFAVASARNADLLSRERERQERVETEIRVLRRACEALNAIAEPDALFDEILGLAHEILRCDRSAILLLEPETGHLVLSHCRGYPTEARGSRQPADRGITGRAYRTGEPVLVPVVSEDAEYIEVAPGTRSEMAVPLRVGTEIIGVLDVERVEGAFGRDDLDLLSAFGEQVKTALAACRMRADARRQLETLDKRARRLDVLNRVSRTLTRRLDADDLLEIILRLCCEAFDIRHCALLLKDPADPGTLVLRAAIGYDETAPRRLAPGQGITGHVAATGVPALVPDVTRDPRYVAGVSGGRSEMAAPLRVLGDIIGVLDAESDEVAAFDEEDLDLFASFAAQAAVAIHNADLAAKRERPGP